MKRAVFESENELIFNEITLFEFLGHLTLAKYFPCQRPKEKKTMGDTFRKPYLDWAACPGTDMMVVKKIMPLSRHRTLDGPRTYVDDKTYSRSFHSLSNSARGLSASTC